MRIAINAAFIGHQRNGLTTCTVGLAEALARHGHRLVVYGSSPHLRGPGRAKLARTPAYLSFENGHLASLLRFLWNQIVLPLRLRHDKVDAVLCHNAEGLFWCPIPQVLIIHDLIPLFYPAEAPGLHRYYKYFLPLLLKRVNTIVTVSHHSFRDLLELCSLSPERIQVIYNGADSRPAEVPVIETMPRGVHLDRYFLFVGSFAPRKNLETVMRAFAKVQEHVPESLVVLAYPDRRMNEARTLMRNLGILERVILLSNLNDSELLFTYGKATALFLLSEYEGFGFPPLEAMRLGTPAVVSENTALAEIGNDAAVCIAPHDTDAAAQAMLRLSRDDDYRQGLRQPGIERAKMFTWARAAEQVSEILAHILPDQANQQAASRSA